MEKQSIKAEILCDSIERVGNNRATTWKLTYPRMIHAELLTHAMLKSNSASSRAIPFKRMVEMVENDPFIPIAWMKEHKGMQGEEFWQKEDVYLNERGNFAGVVEDMEDNWLKARDAAVGFAKNLSDLQLTKQICNRILEPFLWHTIILTGTEFENFFALRAHPMAEIHLQDLAYKMLEVYNASTPRELKEGEWHIPLGDDILISGTNGLEYNTMQTVKIATARAAQISYLKFGSDDYEDLIDLHDSLIVRPYSGKRGTRELTDPIHASPAAHCMQAMTTLEYYVNSDMKFEECSKIDGTPFYSEGWCHNVRGFKSYRSMLPNENASDPRVIKK